MELELLTIMVLVGVYLVAGVVDSVAGGGGLLTLPALLLAGLPPEVAMGTNKLASSLGMSASMLSYLRAGLIRNGRMLAFGVVAMLAGGTTGAMVVHLFDSATIGRIIVFLLPLGMIATLMPRKSVREATELTPFAMFVTLPAVLFVLGFYEGFFGPGTGSFLVLGLHFILGLGFVPATALAKVFNLAGGASALVIFLWHGNVLLGLGVPLALASITGNLIGSRLAIRVGASLVRRMLIVSLTLLFTSLVWKFYIQS